MDIYDGHFRQDYEEMTIGIDGLILSTFPYSEGGYDFSLLYELGDGRDGVGDWGLKESGIVEDATSVGDVIDYLMGTNSLEVDPGDHNAEPICEWGVSVESIFELADFADMSPEDIAAAARATKPVAANAQIVRVGRATRDAAADHGVAIEIPTSGSLLEATSRCLGTGITSNALNVGLGQTPDQPVAVAGVTMNDVRDVLDEFGSDSSREAVLRIISRPEFGTLLENSMREAAMRALGDLVRGEEVRVHRDYAGIAAGNRPRRLTSRL